jgi:hypothetical protein
VSLLKLDSFNARATSPLPVSSEAVEGKNESSNK